MINLLTSKLALPGDSVYFHSLKTRRPGAPLPTIPDWANDVCARKLQDALLVLLKQRSPNDKSSWKTYVQANNIMVPDRPVTLEEFNQISTPPTAGDFPTLSETVGPKPSAKAPVAAKKGSLTAQSTKALRPSVPPRPPQTMTSASSSTSPPLPVQAPIAPAAPPSRATPTPDDSQLPTAPLISSSPPLPPPPQGVEASADIEMPPSSFPLPTSSLSGADKEKALRPLLHNAATISVQPAPLPVPASRPLVHELYAQAFVLFPTIHTFYGLLTQKAKSLYDYLFNPAVTIIPANEEDTTPDAPDAPMTDATTDETPLLLWKFPPHPSLNWLKSLSTLKPPSRTPAVLVLPKFSPRTTLPNHSTHRALRTPCLHTTMPFFTIFIRSFRNIFLQSKIPPQLKTFFSLSLLVPPTILMPAIVCILTSSAVMFRRHKFATRFYSYLSAPKVSGTDLLTGHHS